MNRVLHTQTIQCVTKEFMDKILVETENNGRYSEPYGLFYYRLNNGKYIAMDNSYGDAWMEEFDSYGECVLWLLGVVDSQGEVINEEKPVNEYFTKQND